MKMRRLIACMAICFGSVFLLCCYCTYEWEKTELDLHNRFVQQVERLATQKKVIVIYNHMDERRYPILDDYCLDGSGVEYQNKFCPHKCFYTDDKSVTDLAHAVVFSARSLEVNNTEPVGLPRRRHANQSWVLLNMESPLYPIRDYGGNIVDNDLYMPAFEGVFNLTMNYRHDADVRIPYGRVLNKIYKHMHSYGRKFNIAEVYDEKRNLVAWISSNCFMERSGRNLLVAQLQQYVQVDIFGECGVYRCSRAMADYCHDLKACYEQIGKRYKFYLALETALCEDYVTEKFFYALEVGMVPIVYGKANYTDIAVPGSFINVMDFESVKDLAVYLNYLDSTPEEYFKFFDWRQHSFVTRTFHMHMVWCSLCSKLWERENAKTVSLAVNVKKAITYRSGGGNPEKNSNTSSNFTAWYSIINSTSGSASASSSVVPFKTLLNWWSDVALSSGVCDLAPHFITNTTLTFEVPVRKIPVRRYIDFIEEL